MDNEELQRLEELARKYPTMNGPTRLMVAEELADCSEWLIGRIRVLRERAEKAERERDEARANYAFMVERAADQKLDGYRELGARAAAAEERAEKAERELGAYKRAKEENDECFIRERDEARKERDEAVKP